MAITRRQFVTRLGALAAAAGFSQAQASQIMDALAYTDGVSAANVYKGTFGKPRVVWLHGAECTGCSTSLLGIFENVNGEAITVGNYGAGTTTLGALGIAGTVPTDRSAVPGLNNAGGLLLHDTGITPGLTNEPAASVDIADIVIDVIDLLYHETVMGMGGDTAYQWLNDFAGTNSKPFVLVVEGALQNSANGGAWGDSSTASKAVAWCSIAMGATSGEINTADIVQTLAEKDLCVAIIAIGQCAAFGGYPGCKSPLTTTAAGFNTSKSQTDAMGVFDYLTKYSNANTAAKVINAPGCPTNPWWFILTVVTFIVDLPNVIGTTTGTEGPLKVLKKIATNGNNLLGVAPDPNGVDASRRVKAVYGPSIHGPYCSRYRYYVQGVYATLPGQTGCLQKIGCKGPAAKSLCGVHGWNNQQPTNAGVTGFGTTPTFNKAPDGVTDTGGHCTRAGHPCMACTERGYPDAFVPFVVR